MNNPNLKRMTCEHYPLYNKYTINHKVDFCTNSYASQEDIQNCLEFCLNMTFNESGAHRSHRTGGIKQRSFVEIFQDIFIGKMGELYWKNGRGCFF